jgi:hypothetical protein
MKKPGDHGPVRSRYYPAGFKEELNLKGTYPLQALLR